MNVLWGRLGSLCVYDRGGWKVSVCIIGEAGRSRYTCVMLESFN